MSPMFVRIAAALCFIAVALGAFGAHALKPMLERTGMADIWNKAVLYHLIHAVALFALAAYALGSRGVAWLFIAGTLMFSGSLYLYALTSWRDRKSVV